MALVSLMSSFLFSITLSYILTRPGELNFMTTFYQVYAIYLLLWALYRFLLYPNLFSPLRHLPTVDGNAWWSRESLRLLSEPRGIPESDWVNRISGGLIRYRTLLNDERLLVTAPEALSEVLTTKSYQFKKPAAVVNGLKTIAGNGILLAEGDQHKLQRKTLSPAFAYRHIKDLTGLMWEISSNAVASLAEVVPTVSEADVPPHVVNINEWASQVTLDIILVAGIGQDMDSVRNRDGRYKTLQQVYKTVFTSSRQDFILLLLRVFVLPNSLMPYVPLKRNREIGRAAQALREVCRELIRQKKKDLESELADKTEKDILTVALSYGGFTEDELIEQLLTFLAAGHETTATALSWSVYALSKDLAMQTRLREEIRAHLPSPSLSEPRGPAGLNTIIDRMPYLHAICLEVLRYFAPVPITIREAAVDTTISGTPVPAGTKVIICPRATNRAVSLWGDDAGVFNPERHLSQPRQAYTDPLEEHGHSERPKKHAGTRSNYATLTFLHGPRSCIGQSFAQSELAILLATLIGRFEFTLADELLRDETKLKLRRGATNRPLKGLKMKVKLVEGW
ncbi:cytochrome P450 [Nemania sp. FL0916]|nr:cytochrome P450 [Nemania sp. FL0916]